MLADVMAVLRCPQCGAVLTLEGDVVGCATGHCYDVARDGHVTLLRRPTKMRSDTAAMVRARQEFLGRGHFAGPAGTMTQLLVDGLGRTTQGCVLDAGAGPGYYLRHILDALPSATGLALDLSPHAARRAAKAHPRLGSVVCDVAGELPVADTSVAAVLSAFAPRNGGEIVRVLRPLGVFLAAMPTADHLHELREPIGMLDVGTDKVPRLERTITPALDHERTVHLRANVHLTHEDVRAAALMGPAAWHSSAADITERVRSLPSPMPVTVSIELRLYRKRAR